MDYEKGTPSWDIGQILTRHGDGFTKNQLGETNACARVKALRLSNTLTTPPERRQTPAQRLINTLEVACTCGAGDSDAERTSIIVAERAAKKRESANEHAAANGPAS